MTIVRSLYFLKDLGKPPTFFGDFFGVSYFLMELKKFRGSCARDGSHGLQGQCGALAEHRSDSGV
ncbi:MAG: hypothetical protein NZ529_04010, partial [Cytophagaceae bacterium]|nr:hypothetical protein [Cytophagaceae bacterium]MDW8455937.1 hypothetical protein [Cytophagaceae bacterium]